MEYTFDSGKIKKMIKEARAKNVLVQLPDGSKPDYERIVQELEGEGYNLFIWGGSCFGACDIPSFSNKKIDLIVHLGHEEF